MYVIDLEGNEYPLQVTRTKTLEINNNETISFTILPTKVNLDFINDITEYWTIVDHDDERYKVIYFRKKGEGKLLSVDIQAIPVYIDELKRRRVYERIDQHMTAHAYFTLVFQDTNYNFVLVDSFDAQMWEGLGEGNDKASMFKDGLNRYGAEFEKVGNTFYLRSLISRETQFMYRHRLNASDITFENDASEFYTFIRGYGDYGDGEGGEDWQDAKLIREYTSPLAQIFGIREAPPLKDGRITDQTTMDEKLKQIVDESLKISVTAKVHDLRKQGYPLAQPRLGDKVFLIDERINFNEELRIVAIEETRDWKGEIIDENVTFGELNLVKRHQAKLLNAVNTINSLLRGQTKLPFSVMDNAVAEATKALHRMQSELNINEQGSLVAVDKNDPNNVVVFNAAGIGISDDGGATFRNALTGKGLVADVITSGSLNTNNVTVFGGNTTDYTNIHGSTIELRGNYNRTWRGVTTTHDVRTRLHNGHLRFRNDSLNRSLYMSEFGISTYVDGEGEGSGSSGSIIWWDEEYSTSGTSGRGLTINSYAGRVALSSDTNQIVIHPRRNDSDRMFFFNRSNDSVNDSYLTYGRLTNPSVALRFFSGRPEIAVVDGDFERGGNTTFDVGTVRTNNIYKRESNTSVYWNGTSGGNTTSSDTLRASGIRALSGTSDIFLATNNGAVRVSDSTGYNNGNINYRPIAASNFVQASSIKHKTNIQRLADVGLDVVNGLEVVEYDLINNHQAGRQVGFIAEYSEMIAIENNTAIDLYRLSSYNTKAIQELSKRLDAIEEMLNEKN